MGIEQRVTCGDAPPWPAVRAALAERGVSPAMRMIDGQLAFPDEEPPAEWRELRVAAGGDMVTLRREAGAVVLVTWGNADDATRRSRNALAYALARVCGGTIEHEGVLLDCDDFLRAAPLPPGFADPE